MPVQETYWQAEVLLGLCKFPSLLTSDVRGTNVVMGEGEKKGGRETKTSETFCTALQLHTIQGCATAHINLCH